MAHQPKRRWFRFRLSTVLILTAIVAWAMACRPTFRLQHFGPAAVTATTKWEFAVQAGRLGPNGELSLWTLRVFVPEEMQWPAIAMGAFLSWKAALAVLIRRRRRSAATE